MAAPPQRGPGPPRKGTMKGSSLAAGNSCTAILWGLIGAALLSAPDPLGLSGAKCLCSRANVTGWSHRLGSVATPAASRWAASRSYWVQKGASCSERRARLSDLMQSRRTRLCRLHLSNDNSQCGCSFAGNLATACEVTTVKHTKLSLLILVHCQSVSGK